MNASSLVPGDLWEAIESLLPKEPPKPNGGRPRVPDRAALGGIVFVLQTGCPWRLLPKELGCGSGTTCWRRLRDRQEAGVWQKLHERLLNWLGDEAAIDWSRASVDSLSVRAKRGANRQDQTRRTAANGAPNTTLSSTTMAFPSPSASRLPMPTTRPTCFRSSMPSRPSLGRGGNRVDPANARPSSTPTRPMTPLRNAAPCVVAVSPHASHDVGSTPPNDWDGVAGGLSAHWRGCSATAALACATSGEQISSTGCCTWPAP